MSEAQGGPSDGGDRGPVVLFRIVVLCARTVQERGLRIRRGGQEIVTGPLVGHLDETAEAPGNLGLINLATGAVTIRWAVVAEFPLLADAFAGGQLPQRDSAPVRLRLEESGKVVEDGSGFDLKGRGRVLPGSFLSRLKIPAHPNRCRLVATRPGVTVQSALNGGVVRFAFEPESSYVEARLPASFGGGTQRLNLVGGFTLLPLMTLPGSERRRGRR